jgi:hypothetical protein
MTCVKNYDKRIFACLFHPKGHQNKSLLNLNSDAHTNPRLRDTITNYGFRIDTNAYVFSNEKFGECRLSDLSRTVFRPLSIILLQSWPKSIKAQYIPKDTVRLRVQYLQDIVVHQQLNIYVYQFIRGLQIQTRLHTVPYLEKYMDALL